MPNYKPYADSISIGGFNKSIDFEDLVVLYSDINSVTSAQSLKDCRSNIDYSVPSGKVLKIFALAIEVSASGSFVIYEAATADAETTGKIIVNYSGIGRHEYAVVLTFASGKFVTFTCAGGTADSYFVYGYLI